MIWSFQKHPNDKWHKWFIDKTLNNQLFEAIWNYNVSSLLFRKVILLQDPVWMSRRDYK